MSHAPAVLMALCAAIGFSSKAIFVKLVYLAPDVSVSAVTLVALRMFLALPVFLWVAFRGKAPAEPLARRDAGMLILLGIVGYYGSSLCDFQGLKHISAALERLILYTYPTLTVLIAVIFFRHRLTRRECASIALSYAGIGLAFAHDLNASGTGDSIWIGAGLVFAASLLYAAYLSGSAPMIARLGSVRFTALCMTVSCIGTILHFLATEPFAALALPWRIYTLIFAMALFSTILPVFMLSAAIARIGAARTVLIGSIGPIVTIFMGWLWLDERLSLPQIIGALLVLAGVLLVSLARKKPA
ncbi:MAG: DMT family transporter [Zoogloeaceae bacterium]|jgi:drug/metabolite transporter (DMT)-like permease|nr:DMT family transporter [Zoogloeaceae bacterium]